MSTVTIYLERYTTLECFDHQHSAEQHQHWGEAVLAGTITADEIALEALMGICSIEDRDLDLADEDRTVEVVATVTVETSGSARFSEVQR